MVPKDAELKSKIGLCWLKKFNIFLVAARGKNVPENRVLWGLKIF
jgi:hypothetical protein